jgi:aminopeptidase N
LVSDQGWRTQAVLAAHETDGFNRWFAADALARNMFAQTLAAGAPDARSLTVWTDCLARVVDDRDADPALVAELLTVADAASLSDGLVDIDPEAVHRARARIETSLATALAQPLLARYHALADTGAATSDELAAQARRRLRNVCLAALCRVDAAHLDLARAQYANARTLTDRLAALAVVVHLRAGDADAALAEFARRYANDALVLDSWFALQATEADPRALERVEALTAHYAFHWSNPNKVHALIGSFARANPRAFHRADGAGYRFVADAILKLDAITPQVAARLATAFRSWRSYEPLRRAMMHHELERIAARHGNSPDLTDIVARSLMR